MNHEYDEEKNTKSNVLITELGEEAYEKERQSSSDENEEDLNYDLNDDDDIFMVAFRKYAKKSKRKTAINFDDIENEKDYETDLEGCLYYCSIYFPFI